MKRVFTVSDLDGVPAGGEVTIAENTLITPLAGEEAERRGITLRVVTAERQEHSSGAAAAPSPRQDAASTAAPEESARRRHVSDLPVPQADFGELVRVVTEEILHYLGGSGAAASAVGAGPRPADAEQDTVELHDVARLIDHTLLRPEASADDIRQLCRQAAQFGFASVCINPWHVALAVNSLHGTGVKVCTVVGFPLGASLPQVKIFEAEQAIKLGAAEIDMVINIGALKSGQDEAVELDIRGVVEAAHRGAAICKVILETSLLTREEKVRVLVASKRAGADFVKTSTGFSTAGATPEDVALMRTVVGAEIGVKAAGGVRTFEELKKMVRAGATRIGASASVKIMEEAARKTGKG